MKTVYVVGAGADFPLGVPLANTLLASLGSFAKTDGKAFDRALRGKLPRVRFTFDRYVSDQGESLGERLLADGGGIAEKLIHVLDRHPDPKSDVVRITRAVVEQLDQLKRANILPESVAKQLAQYAGEDEESADHTLVKTRGLELTPTTRKAMVQLLRSSRTEIEGLTAEEVEVLDAFVTILTNFEELLADLFAGFYTGDSSRQARYLYIAWLLWAFMRERSRDAKAAIKAGSRSVYDALNGLQPADRVITFNYTDLLGGTEPSQVIPSHGDCRGYLRFDRSEVLTKNEAMTEATDVAGMAAFIESLEFDVPRGVTYLPAIVPPIAMKPLIAPEFLDRWHGAAVALAEANLIVVVGYSFNLIDRHFNDLVRKSVATGSKIAVVNPSVDLVTRNVCAILGLSDSSLTGQKLGGHQARTATQLAIIGARSEEIDGPFLDVLRGGW